MIARSHIRPFFQLEWIICYCCFMLHKGSWNWILWSLFCVWRSPLRHCSKINGMPGNKSGGKRDTTCTTILNCACAYSTHFCTPPPPSTHAFNVFSCKLYELLNMYRECSPSVFLLKAGVLTKPKLMLWMRILMPLQSVTCRRPSNPTPRPLPRLPYFDFHEAKCFFIGKGGTDRKLQGEWNLLSWHRISNTVRRGHPD
jgi:hypothetical protein